MRNYLSNYFTIPSIKEQLLDTSQGEALLLQIPSFHPDLKDINWSHNYKLQLVSSKLGTLPPIKAQRSMEWAPATSTDPNGEEQHLQSYIDKPVNINA